MPSRKQILSAIKRQLKQWETKRATVSLRFQNPSVSLNLFGRIGCGMNCGYFDFLTTPYGYFTSPMLGAFNEVSVGTDPSLKNATTIKLKRRRKNRTQMEITLTEVNTLTSKEKQAIAEASKRLPA